MLTFDDLKILIMFLSIMVIILSSLLFVPLCRYFDRLKPSEKKERVPLSNPVKTSYIVVLLSIVLSSISYYLIIQEARIVAAIGLMIIMLTASTIMTGTMLIGASIMTVRNPQKMARLKNKKNCLSGILYDT